LSSHETDIGGGSTQPTTALSSQETIVGGGGGSTQPTTASSSQETVVGGEGSTQPTTASSSQETVVVGRGSTQATTASSSQETVVVGRGSTQATAASSSQEIAVSGGSTQATTAVSSPQETVVVGGGSNEATTASSSQEIVVGGGSTQATIAVSSSQETVVVGGGGSTQATTASSSQETIVGGGAGSTQATAASSSQETVTSGGGSTQPTAASSSQETVAGGGGGINMYFIVVIIVAVAMLVIFSIIALVILLKNRSAPTPTLQRNASIPNVTPLSDAFLIPFEQIEIGRVIAAGCQGQIHKGTFVGKKVAIKQLLEVMFDPEDIEQLEAEASMLCSLHHPNIVRFYGLSMENSLERGRSYYLVTDLKDTDLKKFMENNSQPEASEIFRIALEVCSALEFLHSRSNPMVHRDLKPGNILLDANRTAFLCDFGLTTVYKDGTNVDMTPNKGTAAYMAPELGGLKNYAQNFGSMEDSKIAESPHATKILVQKHSMKNDPAHNTLATSEQRSNLELKSSSVQPAGRKTSRFLTTAAEACKVDCYAFALVLWGLLSWKLPFRNISDIKIIVAVSCNKQRPSTQEIVQKRWNPKVIYLMRKMWDQEPSARSTMTECRKQLESISENPRVDPEAELQNDYDEDVQLCFGEAPEEKNNDSDTGRKDADTEPKSNGATSADVAKQLNVGDTTAENASVSEFTDDYYEDLGNGCANAPEVRKDDNTAESGTNVDSQPKSNGATSADVDKQLNAGATTPENASVSEFPADYYEDLDNGCANTSEVRKDDNTAESGTNADNKAKSNGATSADVDKQLNVDDTTPENSSVSEFPDDYYDDCCEDLEDDYDNTPEAREDDDTAES